MHNNSVNPTRIAPLSLKLVAYSFLVEGFLAMAAALAFYIKNLPQHASAGTLTVSELKDHVLTASVCLLPGLFIVTMGWGVLKMDKRAYAVAISLLIFTFPFLFWLLMVWFLKSVMPWEFKVRPNLVFAGVVAYSGLKLWQLANAMCKFIGGRKSKFDWFNWKHHTFGETNELGRFDYSHLLCLG